jgi:hypothetical protein
MILFLLTPGLYGRLFLLGVPNTFPTDNEKIQIKREEVVWLQKSRFVWLCIVMFKGRGGGSCRSKCRYIPTTNKNVAKCVVYQQLVRFRSLCHDHHPDKTAEVVVVVVIVVMGTQRLDRPNRRNAKTDLRPKMSSGVT